MPDMVLLFRSVGCSWTSYAVNGTEMTMQGATLYDNGNSRSIAVLLMASTLRTYQVKLGAARRSSGFVFQYWDKRVNRICTRSLA